VSILSAICEQFCAGLIQHTYATLLNPTNLIISSFPASYMVRKSIKRDTQKDTQAVTFALHPDVLKTHILIHTCMRKRKNVHGHTHTHLMQKLLSVKSGPTLNKGRGNWFSCAVSAHSVCKSLSLSYKSFSMSTCVQNATLHRPKALDRCLF
jgi:hypothetical protein